MAIDTSAHKRDPRTRSVPSPLGSSARTVSRIADAVPGGASPCGEFRTRYVESLSIREGKRALSPLACSPHEPRHRGRKRRARRLEGGGHGPVLNHPTLVEYRDGGGEVGARDDGPAALVE